MGSFATDACMEEIPSSPVPREEYPPTRLSTRYADLSSETIARTVCLGDEFSACVFEEEAYGSERPP
jgi:hypothetical protein